MPYKDPEKRRAVTDAWRKKKMAEGYGKALWRRRAQVYRNEEILREGLREVLDVATGWSGPMDAEAKLRAVESLATAALDLAPPVDKPITYMPKESNHDEARSDPE